LSCHYFVFQVLGHEGAGIVQSVGSRVKSVKPGDHIIMSFASCGECRNCLSGKPSYCILHRAVNFGGSRLDGSTTHKTADASDQSVHGSFFRQSSFATHALASERNVLVVDKSLPLETLAPLGCGIQTGAGAILNTFQCRAGSSLAVFGCGSVGMAAILAGRVAGCTKIIAVDVNQQRLKLATELGATHTLNGADANLPQHLRDLTGGGLDYSLDTTGNTSILKTAFETLRPLGQCALVGGAPPGSTVSLDMLSILLGRQLRGVIQGDAVSKVFLPQLIDLYRQGRFPFDKFITYYDSLEEINQAIEDSHSGKVIKPVLRIKSNNPVL
jgi:aryl-alcohol dehydrogenase